MQDVVVCKPTRLKKTLLALIKIKPIKLQGLLAKRNIHLQRAEGGLSSQKLRGNLHRIKLGIFQLTVDRHA